MSPRQTRTALIVAAIVFWGVDAILAVLGIDDSLRSICQGIAVTATVLAGVALMNGREPRRPLRVSSPLTATYVSASAPADCNQITIEIPKPMLAIPAQHIPARTEHFPPGTAAQIYDLAMRTATKRAARS